MPDVEAVAAPSAAEEVSLEIPRSGTPEYAQWRIDGTIPAKPKTADSTPADKPKEATSEAVPAPGPGNKESRRKPDAEARIRELTEESRRLKAELDEARKPKEAKADPPPARQPEATRPKPKNDDQVDGKPKYATYEDFVEDLSDWKAEQRIATQERKRAQDEQDARTQAEVAKALEKHPDYWDKAWPAAEAIRATDVRPEVQQFINDSPVLADLLYVIGGTDASLADFLAAARTNPSKALRLAAFMEHEIQQVTSKGSESTQRNDRGQFVAAEPEKPPAKRGPESAPEPPVEIKSRGPIADASEQDPDTVDFRAYKRAADAKELRRLKGA